MKSRGIAIVGGGSIATAFTHELVALAAAARLPNLAITIFEARTPLGPGEPYREDLACNLLNAPAAAMSAVAGDRVHFARWLERRGVSPAAEAMPHYYPRPLYGAYLRDVLADAMDTAHREGIRFSQRHRRVTSVTPLRAGRVRVKDEGGESADFDHVVLSVGNLASTAFRALETHPGFFNDPYPLARLGQIIPRDASVAIVGTSLSAVDVILGLASCGHVGPVHASSRSGILPAVRGPSAHPVHLRHLAASSLRQQAMRNGGFLTTEMVRELFLRDFFENGGRREEASDATRACEDPLDYLTQEIEACAAGPRVWQLVSGAMAESIDVLWSLLAEDEKDRFVHAFRTEWKHRKISFPLSNAVLVRDQLARGRLSIGGGFRRLHTDGDGKFALTQVRDGHAKQTSFDRVINATGFSCDVTDCDDPLVRDLLAQSVAVPDRFGGFSVSPLSGQLIGARGTESPIVPLGTLATGAYFWTNSWNVNVRLAAAQARRLVNMLDS